MLSVARESLALSRKNARLSENGLKAETVTVVKHAETFAALKKAEMEELRAALEYRLGLAELGRIRGVLVASQYGMARWNSN